MFIQLTLFLILSLTYLSINSNDSVLTNVFDKDSTKGSFIIIFAFFKKIYINFYYLFYV